MIEKLYALRELVNDEDIPHPTVPEYKEHHASIQKILHVIDDMIASLLADDTASPQPFDHSSKSVFAYNCLRQTLGDASDIYELHSPGTRGTGKTRYCLCYHTSDEVKAIEHIASDVSPSLLHVNNVELDSVLSVRYVDGERIHIVYGRCAYCKKLYFTLT